MRPAFSHWFRVLAVSAGVSGCDDIGWSAMIDLSEQKNVVWTIERPPGIRGRAMAPPLTPPRGEGEPHPLAFPPNPPALVADLVWPRFEVENALAEHLAPHIGDHFYAPLSTRLIEDTLSKKQKRLLREHAALKATLLAELRACIANAEPADAAKRLELFTACAKMQASRLTELERRAEALRVALLRGRAFGTSSADWNAKRRWQLGRGPLNRPREENRFFEYQVLRAAAFYQPGLVPAQRRLLREAAMELEAEIFAADVDGERDPDPFVFFSPDLARVLPPAAATAKFERYIAEKSALKQELRDAIYAADAAIFRSERERAMADLARRQATRLAALEPLAEDVRREVAGGQAMPYPPAVMPLPTDLAQRIDAFITAKKQAQRELEARLRAVRRELPPRPGNDPSTPAYREWAARQMDAANRTETRFYQERAEEIRTLRLEAEHLRVAIEAFAGPQPELGLGRTMDAFVVEFLAQRRQQASFREYHLACFEPGLAPEQRRLLFDAALVALELPLPASELQPETMPGTVLR